MAGEDLLFSSHGHLGAVVRRPAKRGLRGTLRLDASRDVRADSRVALPALLGSAAACVAMLAERSKQEQERRHRGWRTVVRFVRRRVM
jgi:hypothetical protein